MKNKYLVYLHSCGFSQNELWEIFKNWGEESKDFFENLEQKNLEKYIPNSERREKIREQYRKLDVKKIDATLKKLSVEIVSQMDESYPESLKHIPHSPYILYIRGIVPSGDMFGVVGSRKITSYGKKCIEQIVPDIAKIFPIVSGGAAGCDAEAHKIALQSGWNTVVVVGTGIDQCYPVSHASLFDTIVQSWGAIISIFRVGEPGNPYNFPVRNEIVVGLSRGILVVEAQQKSGSLITAGLCLDMGKDLFAIPWDIMHSYSQGCNSLIKKWEAKCVTESLDILEEYDILLRQSQHKEQIPLLDPIESQIYSLLSQEDSSIENIAELLWQDVREVMIKISLLELKKIIKKDIGWNYRIV